MRDRRSQAVTAGALTVSLVLHASAALGALMQPQAPAADAWAAVDAWVGDTVEVESLAAGNSGEASAIRAAPEPEPTPGTLTQRIPLEPLAPPVIAVPASAPHGSRPATVADPKPPKQRREPRPAHTAAARGTRSTAPTPVRSGVAAGNSEGAAPAVGSGNGGVFGAVGNAEGLRELPRALARALPAAVKEGSGDWTELPFGVAGQAVVILTIESGGGIAETTFEERPKPPAPLVRLVRRAVLLLGKGHFALSTLATENHQESFLLSAQITQGTPLGDEFSDPNHVLERDFVPPTVSKPGLAAFTYASGRRVEIKVELIRRPQ